jgi:hypothetical protein
MANVDRPDGLRPVQFDPNKTMLCYVDDAGTNGLFIGDPVVFTGSTDGTLGVPEVGIASAGSTISGVIIGLARVGDGGANDPNKAPGVPNQIYLADNEDGFVTVLWDPDAIYEIQEDSDSSNIADTDISEACDLTFGAGNTTTGLSGCELDSSNAGTGDNVILLSRVRRADNDHDAANCRFLVRINEHTMRGVGTPK